jgi:hypothetical protein
LLRGPGATQPAAAPAHIAEAPQTESVITSDGDMTGGESHKPEGEVLPAVEEK